MSAYYRNSDDIEFTPLTQEREKELFAIYYAGSTKVNGEWITTAAALAARDDIIHHHLKLAAKLGLIIAKGVVSIEDAISAANFGLLKALEGRSFKSDGTARFGSYIRHYIRERVLQAMRGNQAFRKPSYDRAKVSLSGDGAYSGERTVLNPWQDEVSSAPGAAVTGFKCLFKDDAAYCVEVVQSLGTVDEETESAQLLSERKALIEQAMLKLTPIERATIESEFYGDGNFAEVGRAFGMTREGVRRAHERAMAKLKVALKGLKEELL